MSESRKIVRLVICAAILYSMGAAADPGSAQLDRFLSRVTTLQADFEQTLFDPERTDPLFSRGEFYLSRPDRFRWDYHEPDEQLIVADGRQIWLYEPELEQVSVKSQSSALSGTPASLLISGEPVDTAFKVRDLGPAGGMEWVELIPRDEDSQFARINLGLLNNELLRMEMVDKFGQITRFRFYGIQHNPKLESHLFEFVPPEDADRYNQ